MILLEKGDEKSAELESVGYTKVRGGEHDAVNGQGSEACEKTHLNENTLDPHMHPASDRENNDSKNSESRPALKPPSEFNVTRTARSVGHGDIPGDDNNDEIEMILQKDHCGDCDTALDDKKSTNHHLTIHQQLVTHSIGNLSEDGLNGSVPSA